MLDIKTTSRDGAKTNSNILPSRAESPLTPNPYCAAIENNLVSSKTAKLGNLCGQQLPVLNSSLEKPDELPQPNQNPSLASLLWGVAALGFLTLVLVYPVVGALLGDSSSMRYLLHLRGVVVAALALGALGGVAVLLANLFAAGTPATSGHGNSASHTSRNI